MARDACSCNLMAIIARVAICGFIVCIVYGTVNKIYRDSTPDKDTTAHRRLPGNDSHPFDKEMYADVLKNLETLSKLGIWNAMRLMYCEFEMVSFYRYGPATDQSRQETFAGCHRLLRDSLYINDSVVYFA